MGRRESLYQPADEDRRCREQEEDKIRILAAVAKRITPQIPMAVQSEPVSGEGLVSLMFRTAELNALNSPGELSKELMLSGGTRLTRRRHQQLATSIGCDPRAIAMTGPTQISENAIALGGHVLHARHVMFRTNRICPQCLQEQGHGMAHWDLAPMAVCERHGIYLVDHCKCNPSRRLDLARPGLWRCNCGVDLRLAAVAPATDAARKLGVQIADFFHSEPVRRLDSLLSPLNTPGNLPISLSEFLDLVVFMGALDSDASVMRRALARRQIGIEFVRRPFEQAARALENWPDGFFDILGALLRESGLNSTNRNAVYKRLRPIMQEGERRLSTPLNRWLHDSMARFLDELGAKTSSQSLLTPR